MPTSADYDITATDEQSPANASHRAQKVYILVLAGELITSLTAGMPVEPPIIRRAHKGDAWPPTRSVGRSRKVLLLCLGSSFKPPQL